MSSLLHTGEASGESAPEPAARRERYLACLADLSTRLLQASDPMAVLGDAVTTLRECSGADRCYAFEIRRTETGARSVLRAEANAPGVAPLRGLPGATEIPLPKFDRARADLPMFGPVAGLPAWARRLFEASGVQSIALLPIESESRWWGTLGFEAIGSPVRFADADAALLKIAANAIGAALERAAKEEALRSGEERFRAMIDQAFDLVAEVDEEGRYAYVSRSHFALFGIDAESMIGKSAFERIHPDDLEGVIETFRGMVDTGSGQAVFRMSVAGGGWRWIDSTGRFFVTPGGRRSAVVIGRDVTHKRQADIERHRLEQAMDQATDAIVMWGRDGRITYVNAAWERVSKVPRAEAIGKLVLEATKPIPGSRPEGVLRALRSGETWSGRIPMYGGGFLDATITPVRDEGRVVHFVSVMRDVTREVELEARIRRQQKLEAIGTLASGVAHDFNNLLTGVLGYAELLARSRRDDSEVAEAASVIGEAARRGSDLTSRLLGFGLHTRLRSEPVDVHDTVREVVRLLSHTLPRSIAIESDLDAAQSVVIGDPGQLQQVFLNLAVNARDAMPSGGVLRFSSARVDGPDGPELSVHVSDTGTGIDAELQDRIFEPFFTTKQSEKGSGMGLAVVYGILQSHRGSIALESAHGAGTRFELRLPLAVDGTPPRPAHIEREPTPGSGRILVVDDEPAVRRVAGRMLRRLGYEVVEVDGGGAALALVRDDPAQFAVVILDLDMPGMDGRSCLRALRGVAPDLPIVISSGLPASELGALAETEASALLPKPYQLFELSEAVAAARARRG
ncbi:MAG TPA: PAS domain S-box protein [Myxococcota bacterium]|nr:PAS domain S-box protein [Myxococcota bacterium]